MADHVCEFVRSKPTAVLGLVTGIVPVWTYHGIIGTAQQKNVSFGRVRAFMLDEFLGISDDHPCRLRNRIQDFTKGVGIKDENLVALPNHWPSGPEPDVELAQTCKQHEQDIDAAGGIDLQVLGISARGHIAFNEPMSSLASRTRVKTLTESTRRAVAGMFAELKLTGDDPSSLSFEVSDDLDNVPDHVVTQGIRTILESSHVILVATGEARSKAVAQAIEGPVTSYIPASALQLHEHATFVLDEDAASQLKMREYYQQVRKKKRYVQPPIS